jgi:outer membrane murein-binding lipoprotein Lpp
VSDPISRLQRQLDDLDERLNHLTGHNAFLDISEHEERLDGLERYVGRHYVGELAERVESLEHDLAEVTSTADDAASTSRRVEQRLRLLERRLRASGGTPAAELDKWPADFKALVAAVRTGRELSGHVLTDLQRASYVGRIDAPNYLRRLQVEKREKMIAYARTLASADPTDRQAWQEVRDAWPQLAKEFNELADRFNAAVDNAARAREEFDAAEARQREVAGRVQHGQQCYTKLLVRIRTRLVEALRDDLLLPMWFETALGPTTPTENTEQWLDTAVQVIAYRLIYQVDDQALALGTGSTRRSSIQTATRRRRRAPTTTRRNPSRLGLPAAPSHPHRSRSAMAARQR